MDRRFTILVKKQFAHCIAADHPNLLFGMSDNISVWYIKLHRLVGGVNQLVGGEYICRVNIPEQFPFAPVKIDLLTPSGFDCKICVGISSSVMQACENFLGDFLGESEKLPDTVRRAAGESRAYNSRELRAECASLQK